MGDKETLLAEYTSMSDQAFKEFIESSTGELCLSPNIPIEVVLKSAFIEGRISKMQENSHG